MFVEYKAILRCIYFLPPLLFIVLISALTDVVVPGSFDMNRMLCEVERGVL